MPGILESNIPLKQREIVRMVFETQSEETPFTSALFKDFKPGKVEVEYQAQIRDFPGHEGTADGEDVVSFDSQQRDPFMARMQEFRQSWKVSQQTEATKQEGVEGQSEARHQKAIAGVKLKEMLEARFLSDAEPKRQSGAAVNETAGVGWWLFDGTSSYFNVPVAHRLTSAMKYTGALADLTENHFKSLAAEAYKARNGVKLMLDGWVGVDLKNHIDGFLVKDTTLSATDTRALRTYNLDGKSKTVINCVDFLTLGFADIRLHPTTYLLRGKAKGEAAHADAHRTGYFLDQKQWATHFVGGPLHKQLPDLGGGPRGYWQAMAILRCNYLLGQFGVRCAS